MSSSLQDAPERPGRIPQSLQQLFQKEPMLPKAFFPLAKFGEPRAQGKKILPQSPQASPGSPLPLCRIPLPFLEHPPEILLQKSPQVGVGKKFVFAGYACKIHGHEMKTPLFEKLTPGL